MERKESARKSVDKYFQKITYGVLPAQLKVRFREAKDIFYNMCDLKVIWNELPDEAEDQALELQLQIEALDTQRETIWRESTTGRNTKPSCPQSQARITQRLTPQQLYPEESKPGKLMSGRRTSELKNGKKSSRRRAANLSESRSSSK